MGMDICDVFADRLHSCPSLFRTAQKWDLQERFEKRSAEFERSSREILFLHLGKVHQKVQRRVKKALYRDRLRTTGFMSTRGVTSVLSVRMSRHTFCPFWLQKSIQKISNLTNLARDWMTPITAIMLKTSPPEDFGSDE
jgi:hypothetical protein